MIQIKIDDDQYLMAHNFAEQCAESCLNNYKRRGQGNKNKIVTDIHIGKLLELGAYKLLRNIGIKATFPDFEVYESKGKSWDADITAGKDHFHCKGQGEDSVNKYGLSWLLQYGGNGKGHTDKLFKHQSNHDFLIPGYIKGRYAVICGIFSVKDIMENGLIGLPKVHQLRFSKRAVYWSDLQAHYSEGERWGPFIDLIRKTYES